MEDYELILFDRINVIRDTINKYGEENFYLSLSGGKDSTVLHYLIDKALPSNTIPRIFIDTGIEYQKIREFVYKLAEKDKRIVIIKPSKPILTTLNEYGFPFKSKQHSHNLAIYQRSGLTRAVRVYLGEDITQTGKTGFFKCPEALRYQFTPEFKIKCSDLCCQKMKKEPALKWAKENKKTITLTGMRSEEGGARLHLGCIIKNSDGSLRKFHPLVKVSDEWLNEFIEKEKIKLCELYYDPYNFKRTGCKGCPFALHLQEELSKLKELLPNEYKQCEIIWKPVYEEYRKINYRLKEK